MRILLLVLFTTVLFADFERYEVKSAKVEYKISGKGQIMGVITNLSGKKSVLFKNYGALEINKEYRSQNIMGQVQNTEDIVKLENGIAYSVDNEENIIYKTDIPFQSKNPLMAKKTENVLSSLGAKKVGTETVAGVKCNKWEFSDIKMCVYKGIPLKMETNIMGVKEISIAKSAKFNVSIDDSEFNLPNYPVKDGNDMMNEAQAQMEEEMKNMSPEERKMMQEMMKNMNGMFGNN